MAKFILSAFADEYSADITEQIAVLCELGYTHIEPRFVNGKNIATLTEGEAGGLAAALDAAGISVYSIGSPIGKIGLDDDFSAHLQLAENCFRVANILGATRVRVFSFYLPDGVERDAAFPEVCEKMTALIDLAWKYGITLCHENEAKIFGESPADCRRLLDAMGGRLRAVFDMGNFVLDGYEPIAAYESLSPYVDYFHIKDALYERAIVPAGKGEAMIAEILSRHLARLTELEHTRATTPAVCTGNCASCDNHRSTDTVITLEPHLESFGGLNQLTDSTFKNPYVFESGKHAFLAGARSLATVLSEVLAKHPESE